MRIIAIPIPYGSWGNKLIPHIKFSKYLVDLGYEVKNVTISSGIHFIWFTNITKA